MHFHWQNLNEKPGNKLGSPLKHGRAWFSVGKGQINWSWHVDWKACALGIKVGGEEAFGFRLHVGVPLVGSLFFKVGDFPSVVWLAKLLLPPNRGPLEYGTTRRLHGYPDERELEFRVHDWALWWTVWRHPHAGWSREVSKWRDGSWHFLDTLLGKAVFSSEVLKSAPVAVPMPERAYSGQAKLELCTWKRPRWFAKTWLRVDIDMDKGEQIPVPGKGENSWDCGDDATFGQTGPAKSIEEAIGNLVTSCLKTRRQRGAPHDWSKREDAA